MDTSLVTNQSIMTIAGAATSVMIVTNVVTDMFKNLNVKYVAFIMCVFLSIIHVIENGNINYISLILLPINACMLYCTAFGLNTSLVKGRGDSRNAVQGESMVNVEMDRSGVFPLISAFFRAKNW